MGSDGRTHIDIASTLVTDRMKSMVPQVLRILDANFNRAREALRVLEEHARLVLDDQPLTQRIKSLRHDLAAAAQALNLDALLAERDIEGDVGTHVTTDGERRRTAPADVADAAGKRAAEALRCLEEYGKIICPDAAADCKRLRYALYAVEQDLHCAGPRRRKLRVARLHVLVTESLCRGSWQDVCAAAIDGGADAIQLREKDLPDGALLARATFLRERTRERNVLLVINDRPDIARLAGADAVHLGQHDLPVAEARRIVGPTLLVGKSTHSPAQLREAMEEMPDYVAVGPMFASPTKPDIPIAGPALLVEAAGRCDVPIVAIGGITADNVAQLHAGRPFAVAVSSAVIAADDPRAATAGILAAMAPSRLAEAEGDHT